MKTTFRMAVLIIALVAVLPVCAQQIDWASVIKDMTSTDTTLRETRFQNVLDKIYPALCGDQELQAQSEVSGLVDQFEQKDDVARLQVSAMLYMIGRCRSDGQVVLAKALPVLMVHAENDPSQRIRTNSIRTLAELKPDIPDAVISLLARFMEGPDDQLAALATYGIVRKVTPGSRAEDLVSKALLPKSASVRKQAALGAITSRPENTATDVLLMSRLGDVLGDPNLSIVKADLNAMSHLGEAAIAVNRRQLSALAESSQDAEVSGLAKQLLARDTGAPRL